MIQVQVYLFSHIHFIYIYSSDIFLLIKLNYFKRRPKDSIFISFPFYLSKLRCYDIWLQV